MKKQTPSSLTAALGPGAEFLCHNQKKQEAGRCRISPEQLKLEKELVNQMAELIRDDRFQLAVQPVVDLQTGGIVGGEVLSRLNHPERGIVLPEEFIHAVEDAGLYPEFDYYIFRKSCQLMKRLIDQGVVIEYLSCNFSRKTLSLNDTAARVSAIADEFGVPHDRMAVEITEREQETDSDTFCENLIELKKDGFRIFVDDLGAGVTSTRDLWSIPVDVVKVDRSLLLAADTEQGRSAYRGLRNLVVDLGSMVLCEGVENESQQRFLQDVGCHYCQGFLFYRPMKDEHFLTLMGEKR